MKNDNFIFEKIQNILNEVHKDSEKKRININFDCYNFACPYCGDSHKDKYKKRGRLYFSNWFYVCYNEGCKTSLFKFFSDFNQKLLPEEKIDLLQKLESTSKNIIKQNSEELLMYLNKLVSLDLFLEKLSDTNQILSISKLKENSFQYNYLKYRGITNDLHDYNKIYSGIYNNKPILVFVNLYNDKIISFQIRSINGPRIYKVYTFNKIWKLFNTDELLPDEEFIYNKLSMLFGFFDINPNKPITILEGFLDKLFIPNSIALIGKDTDMSILLSQNLDLRFIFDNDEPGKKIALKYGKLNYPVFLWKACLRDLNIKYNIKDINDLFLNNPKSLGNYDNWFSYDKLDLALL